MNEQENIIRIAVIEEQISALQQRFDRIEKKIDEFSAIINRGRGAYAASLVLAGLIGGFVLKLFALLSTYFQR